MNPVPGAVAHDPILIWGTGAVGGTLAAYWARAGVPVLPADVVAEHMLACRTGGLAIEGPARARTRRMHELLRIFEPRAVLTDNIWGYLLDKLAQGAMLFATAVTADSMAANFADAGRASLVALAEFNRHTAKTHSGICRDLAVRKRRTEADPQIGDIEEGRRTLAYANMQALIDTCSAPGPA